VRLTWAGRPQLSPPTAMNGRPYTMSGAADANPVVGQR
jgi:hypothetical protein